MTLRIWRPGLMEKNELITFENNEYKLKIAPAKVDFDGYQDLKDKITKIASDWNNYVVTKDSYNSDKKTRAELNKLKSDLDSKRLEIVRKASDPINQFNDQLKDLAGMVKSAADHIGEGLKFFDDQARKAKHQQNLILLGTIAQEYGIALQKLEYDAKWDNKTASHSAIEESARKQFDVILQQENARKEAIKVIQDKAENYTKPSMVANPYINMLAYKGLPDILKQMDSDHDYLLKQAQKQAETKRKQLEAVEQHGDKYINKNTGEVVDKIYTIKLRLTGTKEQLTQLSKFIQDWGIKYEKVGK